MHDMENLTKLEARGTAIRDQLYMGFPYKIGRVTKFLT